VDLALLVTTGGAALVSVVGTFRTALRLALGLLMRLAVERLRVVALGLAGSKVLGSTTPSSGVVRTCKVLVVVSVSVRGTGDNCGVVGRLTGLQDTMRTARPVPTLRWNFHGCFTAVVADFGDVTLDTEVVVEVVW
jgi:hypothetical protein